MQLWITNYFESHHRTKTESCQDIDAIWITVHQAIDRQTQFLKKEMQKSEWKTREIRISVLKSISQISLNNDRTKS